MSFLPQKRSWFSRLNLFARRAEQTSSRQLTASRPSLEALEDRMLLSMTPITFTEGTPQSSIVQIEAKYPDGTGAQGTGTMVNANTVLTAGHVVYNNQHGGWATQIEVIAGLNGNSKPYGVAYMTYEQTFNSFMADNSENHPPGDGDIGFISLNRDLGDLTGWLGFYGGASTSNTYQVGKFGYPGTDGFNGSQMYLDNGSTNSGGPSTVSGFAYWGWSTSSMSAIPGESGSSLILSGNGQTGIIGVEDVGNSSEGYAEATTQAVTSALSSFEQAHPAPGTMGSLVLTSAPPSVINAGSGFSMAVAAEDGYGNLLATYNTPMQVSIVSGPNGATLGGTYTANTINSVANFTNVDLNTPGTYTLRVSSNEMNSVTMQLVVVEPLQPPASPPPVQSPPPAPTPPVLSQPSAPSPPPVSTPPFGSPQSPPPGIVPQPAPAESLQQELVQLFLSEIQAEFDELSRLLATLSAERF